MTSRERVLTALARQPTDRVPRLLYEEAIGYTPAIERLLRIHCGPKTPCDYFQMDITSVTFNPTLLPRARFVKWLGPDGSGALTSGQVDEWGVWWKPANHHHLAHPEPTLKGIDDLAQLKEYPWPDLDAAYRWRGVKERVAALHQRGIAVTAYAGSVFEHSWYLRGMDQLLMDMLAAPQIAHWFFERTSGLQQSAAQEFARAGVDILILGDDIAGQNGMLMKLDVWREFLKHRLAATVRAIKQTRPETFVFYHSDGKVDAAIPELVEVGVEILNPIQPECMEPAAVKLKYGDRLSFWGTVSVQQTMPFGTPQQVRDEVRSRIRTVGKGGGLILAPAHVLSPETPWDNIVAFFETADTTAML